MYAIKRQLRIWKHEFLQLWDKVPFLGRIILGAVISVGFAIHFASDYIQPLNVQVRELSKLEIPENLDIAKDEEIIMNKEKAKNLQPAIKRSQNDLDKRKKELDILSESARGEVINAFQQLFARCGLRVLSEQSLENVQVPTKTTSKKSKSRSKSKTAVVAPVDDGTSKLIASKQYQYKIAGSFKQIQAFLLLSETLKWRFKLSEFSLKKDTTSANGLELDFKLSIYYFK